MPIAIVQSRLVPGPPIGAGAVVSFAAPPTAGSLLIAMFNAPAITGLYVGAAAGWTSAAPGVALDSGSGGGHAADLEVWYRRAAVGEPASSTWTLPGTMTAVRIFEVAGSGVPIDISTCRNQGSNIGGILTSPVLVATPTGFAGIAFGFMGHDGGTHFDAGNLPNGDFLAAAAAGWTIDDALNVSGSDLVGHQAYAANGPAVSWGWQDHNAGNANWGGILFRLDASSGGGFPGEPGGGIW